MFESASASVKKREGGAWLSSHLRLAEAIGVDHGCCTSGGVLWVCLLGEFNSQA